VRVVLLTRTGRPSGREILKKLVMAEEAVTGVVVEKRASLLLEKGIFHFIRESIKRHGFLFLMQRVREVIRAFSKGREFSLRDICEENGVTLFMVENHNSSSTEGLLRSLRPDLLITANTRIIKGNILKIPQKGAINFHTSKLPQYAGLDSIFWALYHGEKEIGVTIHFLKEKLDTGDIILQETIPVQADDDLTSLTRKANELGGRLIVKVIEGFKRGDLKGVPQDLRGRTYFSWPTPSQRRELLKRKRQLNA